MKISFSSFFVLTGIFLLSCKETIDTPRDLISANLRTTSGGVAWEELVDSKMISEEVTIIGGNEVNKVSKVIYTRYPQLRRTEVYYANSLTQISIVDDETNLLVKFIDGEYAGLNKLPNENLYINKVFELVGIEDSLFLVDTTYMGSASYVINKGSEQFVFDKQNTFLIAYVSETPYGTSTTSYQDYRKVGGYFFPFQVKVDIPQSGYRIETVYQEISVNSGLDDKYFERDESWYSLGEGDKLPDFKVSSIDGTSEISNEDLSGTVTLIDFWATWCKPCIEEFPNIESNYSKYKAQGFQVLSISVDDEAQRPEKYLQKKPFPWKYSAWADGGLEGDVARKFQVLAIPKPILVDAEGKILAIDADLRGDLLGQNLENIY